MTTSQEALRADIASSPPWGAEQSRLVSWRDPITTQATVASMTGLAYWQAVADGHLPPPPIGELMQMRVVDGRQRPHQLHLHTGRVDVQPARNGARRRGVHPARHGDRLRAAHHLAARHRLHVDRNQGQLPQSGHRGQRAADRGGLRRQSRVADRVRRGRGHRRGREPRRHRDQHAVEFDFPPRRPYAATTLRRAPSW